MGYSAGERPGEIRKSRRPNPFYNRRLAERDNMGYVFAEIELSNPRLPDLTPVYGLHRLLTPVH
jgi:hypothetical protein